MIRISIVFFPVLCNNNGDNNNAVGNNDYNAPTDNDNIDTQYNDCTLALTSHNNCIILNGADKSTTIPKQTMMVLDIMH